MFVALAASLLLAWALGFARLRCSLWAEDNTPVSTGLHSAPALSEVHDHLQREDPINQGGAS